MLARERRGDSVSGAVEGDISTLRIWVTFQLWVYTENKIR